MGVDLWYYDNQEVTHKTTQETQETKMTDQMTAQEYAEKVAAFAIHNDIDLDEFTPEQIAYAYFKTQTAEVSLEELKAEINS